MRCSVPEHRAEMIAYIDKMCYNRISMTGEVQPPKIGTILDGEQSPELAWRASVAEKSGPQLSIAVSRAAQYGYDLHLADDALVERNPALERADLASEDELFPALNLVVVDRNEQRQAAYELFPEITSDPTAEYESGILVDWSTSPDSVHCLTTFDVTTADPPKHQIAILEEHGLADVAARLESKEIRFGDFIAEKLAEEACQILDSRIRILFRDQIGSGKIGIVEAYNQMIAGAVRRLLTS